MADPSEDPDYEYDPEEETCGDLKEYYQILLDELTGLKNEHLSDVALCTEPDIKICREIISSLNHAKETRKRDFEKFSKAMDRHRDVVALRMRDLREKKAAHTANVDGSALALRWSFAGVVDAVRVQRDMERAACKMLVLTGVTDCHLTVLDNVCLKIANLQRVRTASAYCERVLEVLRPLQDHLVIPDDIMKVDPNPFKGLELVQENIDHMNTTLRAQNYARAVPLGDTWTALWGVSVAFRKVGASPDEIKLLWYFTMRQRPTPDSLKQLRTESPIVQEGLGLDGVMSKASKDAIQGPPIPLPKRAKAPPYSAEKALRVSRDTRPERSTERTEEQIQQLHKETFVMLSNLLTEKREYSKTKGAYETFLESFYDYWEDRDSEQEPAPSYDIKTLAARMIGDYSGTKSKSKKKTSANPKSAAEVAHQSTSPHAGRSIAQSSTTAGKYLTLYYERFERRGFRPDKEDDMVDIATPAKWENGWRWVGPVNDATLLESLLLEKVCQDQIQKSKGSGQ